MKQFIILIVLLSASIIGVAQDCPYYDKYIQKGNTALKAEQFEEAINHYSTAMLHCPEKVQVARGHRGRAHEKNEERRGLRYEYESWSRRHIRLAEEA